MAKEQMWTVVRFPSGTWSYGGSIDDPSYKGCEVFRISAFTSKQAVRKAQAKRLRDRKKAEKPAAPKPNSPRKTAAQIRTAVGFREITPSPCCANCADHHWDGCRHDPSRTLSIPKHPRICLCNHHKFKRGAK